MKNENMRRTFREQRRYRRFRIEEVIFAVLRPKLKKLGRIKDISQGGLAVEYISAGEEREMPSAVGIIVPGEKWDLTDLPCRYVYDHFAGTNKRIRDFDLRCLGIEFVGLRAKQKRVLHEFMKKFAKGPGKKGMTSNNPPSLLFLNFS